MGRNTPRLSRAEKKDYLKRHLSNELEWLLRSAAEWHVQNTLRLGVPGYEIQVFAMDSAALHARTLFEFFTKGTTDNYYGLDAFDIGTIPSELYTDDWEPILHSFLMHAQDRSDPKQLLSFDRTIHKDLNQMAVDFAREIVRLWKEMIIRFDTHSVQVVRALAPVATGILDEAIDHAVCVLESEIYDRRDVPKLVW
jgi:hypothetical protein